MARRATILMTALAVLGTVSLTVPVADASAQLDPPSPALQIEVWERQLQSPENNGARLLAAEALLARGDNQSIQVLLRSLEPQNPAPVQIAVAEAVSRHPGPDRRLIEPLMALLHDGTPPLVQRAAGRALGSYREHPQVFHRLSQTALGGGTVSLRQAAVVGLARIPSRQSAETLMLLLDGVTPEAIEREATRALSELTGMTAGAGDVDFWHRWWLRARTLDEEEFAQELMEMRLDAAEADSRRATAAMAALLTVSRQHYRRLEPAEQTELLVEYLSHGGAEWREVGAELALEDASFAQELAEPVVDLIVLRIADPEPRVRRLAALVVDRRGEATAVEPLLEQLSRETDGLAKLAQVEALAKLQDARAVPALLEQLGDTSAAVRAAAARGAAEIATGSGDSNLRRRVAIRLRDRFETFETASRSGRRARRDILAALSRIPEPTLVIFYRDLLTQPPAAPPAIRELALAGLAVIGDTRTADLITTFLQDEDARVREAAVRALATTSEGFERAETLWTMLDERREPSEQVRTAAWETLVVMFPRAPVTQLARWPDRLRDRPERRLVVLRVLADRAEQAGEREALAFRRQEMGDVLMHELNRPGEAADLYRAALDYSLEAGGVPATIQARTRDVLRSLVRAGRFDEAGRFASQTLTSRPAFVEDLGSIVKIEAQRFAEAGDSTSAIALIDMSLGLEPPLDPRTRRQLEDYRRSLPGA